MSELMLSPRYRVTRPAQHPVAVIVCPSAVPSPPVVTVHPPVATVHPPQSLLRKIRVGHHLFQLQGMGCAMRGQHDKSLVKVKRPPLGVLDKMGLKVIPGGCQIGNRRIPAGDKRLDGGGYALGHGPTGVARYEIQLGGAKTFYIV